MAAVQNHLAARGGCVIRLEPDGQGGCGLTRADLDPDDFQSQLPVQNVHEFFADADAGISVGVWDTTTMQEAFGPYPGDEFIVVLEGCFAMIDAEGVAVTAGKGQSVCFRNAIPTSWKQDGYLKKFYVTWRDPQAQTPDIASAAGGVIVLDADPQLGISGHSETIIFSNDTGNMTVRYCQLPPGTAPVAATLHHDFVQVLQGDITLTGADGSAQVFARGDVFFIPKGTLCGWTVNCESSLYKATLFMR